MARQQIVIHENKGATAEVARYTGTHIPRETKTLASIKSEVAKESGLTAVQVQSIIEGSFEAIEELEREGLVRVHTDIGTVCGVITGSFPTADASFDRDRNTLELALRLEDDLKLSLVNEVPSIVADEKLTKLRVDNVMDLEQNKPYNVIHGCGAFRVAGFNMVLDDEDAGVCLQNRMGVTFDVTVEEAVSKQLFVAHTDTVLDAGDYKLVVKSRAGDAEGPLQVDTKNVKYLHVGGPWAPPMTVNGATSCSTPWTIHGASTTGMFHMTGENIVFTDAEDEGVWFTYTDDSGETVVKHATPDKVHQSTTPGAAPYVFDRDFVGGDGSPDHKFVGTLKIASRAGVPGSLLQVFEHECAWDVD